MTSSIDNGREQQLLARTMAAMEALQQRLKAQADREREPIAVIGLGCRFPGVGGPDAFAAFLARGESAIGRLSPARIAEGSGPGAAIYQTGGFFPDVSAFDAEAFGLNADEALAMDPHLRFLLEVTRDAIDDAGLGGKRLAGTRTGVFLALGAQNSDYATALMSADGEHARHAIAGSFHSLMTGRISYHFDLRGPSFVVDAACASSLVAVDLACQALRRGDCETAIVGAVNLILSDAVSRAIDRHGLWSKQGCVSSHDERADGFVRGEGVGVLVLRRASDATRQENPVRAMILGAATGQDGHGNGIAAPNAPAQLAVIERALKQAAVSAGAIAHVECHATGTRLGDAIEMEAIAQAYGAAAERGRPVVVAALKPLLGHLEAASGMAALVKVFLAREAGRLPHARPPRTLNAEIAALEANLGFSSTAGAWPADTPFAAISAFGMSGTNAHVIVGPPPAGGAARRPRPSYPAFRRQRFWPGFIAERQRATEAAAIRSSHAECFGVEWQVIPDAGRTVSDPVILAGSGAMSERLAAVLRAGGISFRSLETGEPVPQGAVIVFLVGTSFADLEGLHGLVRDLAQAGTAARLIVATMGAEAGQALQRAAVGLGRAIAAEHPDLAPRIIDVDPDVSEPYVALHRAVGLETAETVVRSGREGVFAPRIVVAPVAPATFRPDPAGSYLVTGGFGGIGRAVARRLAERGARHLTLVGRQVREVPEAAEFAAGGVKVKTVAADVADRKAMADLLAQLAGEGHPVKGVFHVAGEVANGLLSQQDRRTFAAPFRSKLLGASILDALTRGVDLDAFVLFSSLTAFVPLAGAAAYGAANASLGAIAQARRRAGLPALCIHWGTWESSGMLGNANQELAAQWQRHGIRVMQAGQALDLMEGLIATGRPEAIVADCDWASLVSHARGEASGASLYERLLGDRVAEPAPPQASSADIGQSVRQAVAAVLGMDPSDHRLESPFGELGLGSLDAVELRNRLSTRLGIRLPASLAFNHPSVQAVIDEIMRRVGRKA